MATTTPQGSLGGTSSSWRSLLLLKGKRCSRSLGSRSRGSSVSSCSTCGDAECSTCADAELESCITDHPRGLGCTYPSSASVSSSVATHALRPASDIDSKDTRSEPNDQDSWVQTRASASPAQSEWNGSFSALLGGFGCGIAGRTSLGFGAHQERRRLDAEQHRQMLLRPAAASGIVEVEFRADVDCEDHVGRRPDDLHTLREAIGSAMLEACDLKVSGGRVTVWPHQGDSAQRISGPAPKDCGSDFHVERFVFAVRTPDAKDEARVLRTLQEDAAAGGSMKIFPGLVSILEERIPDMPRRLRFTLSPSALEAAAQ